jgi:hypothetical protein
MHSLYLLQDPKDKHSKIGDVIFSGLLQQCIEKGVTIDFINTKEHKAFVIVDDVSGEIV